MGNKTAGVTGRLPNWKDEGKERHFRKLVSHERTEMLLCSANLLRVVAYNLVMESSTTPLPGTHTQRHNNLLAEGRDGLSRDRVSLWRDGNISLIAKEVAHVLKYLLAIWGCFNFLISPVSYPLPTCCFLFI